VWDLLGIMGLVCALSAFGLSLVIRSWAQGVAIMSVFTAGALAGLFLLEGSLGLLITFSAGAGVFGCAAAIGTFRFWPSGTPMARASLTLAILSVLVMAVGTAAYLGIPT
jgi:hypothetical protein